MLMTDNSIGGVGAAPAAKGDVVSVRRGDIPTDNNPEAILDATSRLEAGGDGGATVVESFECGLPRGFGAIMVGASRSTVPRTKTVWSNYGSRVDVHAWGENITTSRCVDDGVGNGVDDYEQFSGTSGASPIVIGAVLSAQGMLTARC
jgi:subtilisin family serine protease